jgi:hypothetical protein
MWMQSCEEWKDYYEDSLDFCPICMGNPNYKCPEHGYGYQ